MSHGDILRLFYKVTTDADGNISQTPKDFEASLPRNDEKKLSKLINIYENLMLWHMGEKKEGATENQKALIGEALRRTTFSMRNLNNVLVRKERSDLIGKLRDTIKDTQQRAVSDISMSDSDSNEKAESSVGMSGRSSYIKYLSDYRNMKSSSTPPQTLKRWAARNLDFSGKSGYGKIPFDESVRAINPQSRWTLEQLSRDRDKMVRADAKRTMAKMKSTKGNLDGKSISLYDAQKIEAEKILRVLSKYEDSPDALYKYHNVQTERNKTLLEEN